MVVGCVGTGYVLRVELPVQRRLCPIFVRDVGSPDIHECFRRLTGSQRTPGIWGVTSAHVVIKPTHIQVKMSTRMSYVMHGMSSCPYPKSLTDFPTHVYAKYDNRH